MQTSFKNNTMDNKAVDNTMLLSKQKKILSCVKE